MIPSTPARAAASAGRLPAWCLVFQLTLAGVLILFYLRPAAIVKPPEFNVPPTMTPPTIHEGDALGLDDGLVLGPMPQIESDPADVVLPWEQESDRNAARVGTASIAPPKGLPVADITSFGPKTATPTSRPSAPAAPPRVPFDQAPPPAPAPPGFVQVGCGIPQPLYMMRPERKHGVMDQFKWQRTSADETDTINILHFLLRGFRGNKCLMMDMGANDGFYALLAAAYGCRVKSMEPQASCVRRFRAAIANNTVPGGVELLHAAVGPGAGKMLTVSANDREPCRGNFRATPKRKHNRNKWGERTPAMQVPFVQIDALAGTDQIDIWHIDTEGAELPVLRSGIDALRSRRVRNLILEVVPKRWKEYGVDRIAGLLELRRMLDAAGLRCVALGMGGVGGEKTKHVYVTRLVEKTHHAWRHGDPRPAGVQLPRASSSFSESHDFWCSRDLAFAEMRGVLLPAERRVFPCEPHGSN